jgi:hypothetical protein
MTQSDRTGTRTAAAADARVTIAEPGWRFAAEPGSSDTSSAAPAHAHAERERPIARALERATPVAPPVNVDPQAVPADARPDALPVRDVPRRVFDERTGDEWRVFERDAAHIPGARGDRCLFFDGEGIVRRVWRYPADWGSLPSAALLALMDQPPLGDC